MEKVQLARAEAARAEAEAAARRQQQDQQQHEAAQQQQLSVQHLIQSQQQQQQQQQQNLPALPALPTQQQQQQHQHQRHQQKPLPLPLQDDSHHGQLSRAPTPPPYSGPSDASSALPDQLPSPEDGYPPGAAKGGFRRYPGLPQIDYRIYSPPLFKLSSDLTTLTSKAEYLSTNAAALVALVRTQASVPPKPYLVFKGSRGRKVDFEVKLNLMALLVPEDGGRGGGGGSRRGAAAGRMDYLRCVGHEEIAYRGGVKPDVLPEVGDGGLEEWCRRFVEDPAGIKTFTLERVVANLDVGWIDGQLRSLVASLKYKGNVDVTFVVTHSKITVQSPDKVNQFFTTVTSLFAGKNRYEVVKSVWPFASSRNGEPGRRCAVQTEETWWREWRGPIGYAIAQKRQGWVTVEDKLEAVMEGKGSNMAPVDWGEELNY